MTSVLPRRNRTKGTIDGPLSRPRIYIAVNRDIDCIKSSPLPSTRYVTPTTPNLDMSSHHTITVITTNTSYNLTSAQLQRLAEIRSPTENSIWRLDELLSSHDKLRSKASEHQYRPASLDTTDAAGRLSSASLAELVTIVAGSRAPMPLKALLKPEAKDEGSG